MPVESSLLKRFEHVAEESEFTVAQLVSEVLAPDGDRARFRENFAAAVDGWAPVADTTQLLERFRASGFGGPMVRQVDFCHSDIAWVFAERQGIPIALAVLVIEAARRCGLDAHGINFPGHFLVSVGNELVDPLAMRTLDPAELETGGRSVEGLLTPATPLIVALRMLNNIKALHLSRGNVHDALLILDYQIALDAENDSSVSSLLFERGEFWQRLGAHATAKEAFTQCAQVSPFPRLREEAQRRADNLDPDDEVWH